MKHFVLICSVLLAGVCCGQTEHWRFEDSLSGEQLVRFEIFTAPGKYAAISRLGDEVSRTIVDSAIRQRLDLFDSKEGHYFVRTTIEAPTSTAGPRASEEEIANMEEMEEMRAQPGREGLDFRLLPETRKLFGLTLHHIELIAEDPQFNHALMKIGEGWLLIGKTIPSMQCQVLSDGRKGVIVESVMQRGPDMHHKQLIGYTDGKAAPQGTFSLTVPAGYTDLNRMVKEEPEPASELGKSVVIEEQ